MATITVQVTSTSSVTYPDLADDLAAFQAEGGQPSGSIWTLVKDFQATVRGSGGATKAITGWCTEDGLAFLVKVTAYGHQVLGAARLS